MMSPLDPGSPNAIFSLNDDCLAEVFRFLDIQDVFQIYQIDPRFRDSACLRFSFGGIDRIDPEFINSCPEDLLIAFLTAFGKTAHSINLKLLTEDEFLRYISYFKNLQELILSEIRVTDGDGKIKVFPKSLKSLALDRTEIADSIMQKWIPALNPSLTTLKLDYRWDSRFYQRWNALNNLHNLSTLSFDGQVTHYWEIVNPLISNNKDTLTTLAIISEFGEYEIVQDTVWESITQCNNIAHLHFGQKGFEGYLPDGAKLFPKLTSMQTRFFEGSLTSVINALVCEETLHSLIIDEFEEIHVPMMSLSSLKRFKNLCHLEIHHGSWEYDRHYKNDFEQFEQLTQLHTLVLDRGAFYCSKHVLKFIPMLSYLSKLMMRNIRVLDATKDPDRFVKQCARVCKKHGIELEMSVKERNPNTLYYAD